MASHICDEQGRKKLQAAMMAKRRVLMRLLKKLRPACDDLLGWTVMTGRYLVRKLTAGRGCR